MRAALPVRANIHRFGRLVPRWKVWSVTNRLDGRHVSGDDRVCAVRDAELGSAWISADGWPSRLRFEGEDVIDRRLGGGNDNAEP
jgi:hypothetical protein